MSQQLWQCVVCSLYNSYARSTCQACFTKNDEIEEANGYVVRKQRLEPIARILLIGVYNDNHILSVLRGIRFILKSIWEFALSFNKHIWSLHIESNYSCPYVLKKCPIKFPKPNYININMMPFIASNDFNKTKLPKYLEPYYISLIKPCLGPTDLDYDTINFHGAEQEIYYLTIQESLVSADRSQRRPGLHVETPGDTEEGYQIMWGSGEYYNYDANGGIFMASSVDNSCAVWDCKIVRNDDKRDVIGHLGDIEHLRSSLLNYEIMKGNCLYWLTDRTPHEALALEKTTYRQFFRLVTNEVSVWYEQHSTKNPNGVEPDTNITTIIKGNKFEKQTFSQ